MSGSTNAITLRRVPATATQDERQPKRTRKAKQVSQDSQNESNAAGRRPSCSTDWAAGAEVAPMPEEVQSTEYQKDRSEDQDGRPRLLPAAHNHDREEH